MDNLADHHTPVTPAAPGDGSADHNTTNQLNPPAPIAHFVTRPELEPIITALGQQPHPLLYTITGMKASGKSAALGRIIEQASDYQSVYLNIAALLTPEAEGNSNILLWQVLTSLARSLGLEDEPVAGSQPSRSLVRARASKIQAALSTNRERKLLLAIDNAAHSERAVQLLLDLEMELLAGLEEKIGPQGNVLVVVASHYPLNWKRLWRRLVHIALLPFTIAQTERQLAHLGCSTNDARQIVLRSGGLVGANHWLWQQRQSGQHSAMEEFQEVYRNFVVPALPSAPQLDGAAKAAALLDYVSHHSELNSIFSASSDPATAALALYASQHAHDAAAGQRGAPPAALTAAGGFNVEEFKAAVRSVSYTAPNYSGEEQQTLFYYAELDRLARLGLVSPGSDGRYHMERHIANLLYLWNIYEQPQNLLFNLELTQGIIVGQDDHASNGEGKIAMEETNRGADVGAQHSDFHREIDPELLIARVREKLRDNNTFRGRADYIVEIVKHVLQLPGYDADTIFIQAGAGSGKTALLQRLLAVLTEVSRELGYELFIPQQPTTVIDTEFSSSIRLGRIRQRVRHALISALGSGVEECFNGFDQAYQDWKELRNSLGLAQPGHRPGGPNKLIRERFADITARRKALEEQFYKACRAAVSVASGSRRRRVILAFDTFDFPVRSGQSAAEVIRQILSQVAGDFFVLIACRPPVEQERQNYIAGNLANYLPDALRQQARVFNLDESHLEEKDITEFYQGRAWYHAAREVDEAMAGALVRKMAAVVLEHEGIPVLLSLLEFYAGLHRYAVAGARFERARMTAVLGRFDELLGLKENFGLSLISMLLREIAPTDQEQEATMLGLLLMYMVDRGVSRTILDELMQMISTNAAADGLYTVGADDVWRAIEAIAGVDRESSTIIKSVDDIGDQPAYKLHDYVSLLFDQCVTSPELMVSSYALAGGQSAPDNAVTELLRYLIARRDLIVKFIIWYMHSLAERHNPERSQTQGEGGPWVYHSARANQIYYGLKLAAIQLRVEERGQPTVNVRLAEELEAHFGVSSADYEHSLPPDDELGSFRSPAFIKSILTSNSAEFTTLVVFGYLFGKTVRELSESAEFGFAEVMLQEVRYYLQDQNSTSGEGREVRVASLVLPLERSNLQVGADVEFPVSFERARQLYYAALLYWAYTTGNYSFDATRWRDRDWSAAVELLEANLPGEFLTALPGAGALPRNAIQYASRYLDWLLGDKNTTADDFLARAYHVAELLVGAEQDERVRASLLTAMAKFVLNNPAIGAEDGWERARELLDAADRAAQRGGAAGERIEIAYQRGFLYRLMHRLRWREDSNSQGADRWYDEAIRRDEMKTIWSAMALNGQSFVLALSGDFAFAEQRWQAGMSILERMRREDIEASGVIAAIGRAYSTMGEILRLKARTAVALAPEALLRASPTGSELDTVATYRQAISYYDTAARLFSQPALSYNIPWQMNVKMQRASVDLELARLVGAGIDEYRRILDELKVAYAYCDAPRKIDAIYALGRVLGEITQLERKEGHEERVQEYYTQARDYYNRGIELAERLLDDYNRALLTEQVTRLVINQPNP